MAEHSLLDAATAELGQGRAAAEFGEIPVDHEPCDPRDRPIDAGAIQSSARHCEERGEQADHDRGNGAEGHRGQPSVRLSFVGRAAPHLCDGDRAEDSIDWHGRAAEDLDRGRTPVAASHERGHVPLRCHPHLEPALELGEEGLDFGQPLVGDGLGQAGSREVVDRRPRFGEGRDSSGKLPGGRPGVCVDRAVRRGVGNQVPPAGSFDPFDEVVQAPGPRPRQASHRGESRTMDAGRHPHGPATQLSMFHQS